MRKYEGERAQTYDEKRAGNKAYQWQQAIVEDILRRHKPTHVMDAPVGTGRFFPIYEELGCDVIGIDISSDMLTIAQSKNKNNYVLLKANAFLIQWPSFVISTRFFGHLGKADKKRFLDKVTSRLLISHRPEDYQYFKPAKLTIIETHEYEDGRHCISLVERSGDIRS